MTHYNRDYSKSPAPKFDAVEDIKDWLGDRWSKVSGEMTKVIDVRAFAFYAEFVGVQGFPVVAWYDLYHGEGAYTKAWDKLEEQAA